MRRPLYATRRMRRRQESVQKIRIGACSLVSISEVVADQKYPFPPGNTKAECGRCRANNNKQTRRVLSRRDSRHL